MRARLVLASAALITLTAAPAAAQDFDKTGPFGGWWLYQNRLACMIAGHGTDAMIVTGGLKDRSLGTFTVNSTRLARYHADSSQDIFLSIGDEPVTVLATDWVPLEQAKTPELIMLVSGEAVEKMMTPTTRIRLYIDGKALWDSMITTNEEARSAWHNCMET